VLFHKLLAEDQAQARALLAAGAFPAFLGVDAKQLIQFVGGDANACVGNDDLRRIAVLVG